MAAFKVERVIFGGDPYLNSTTVSGKYYVTATQQNIDSPRTVPCGILWYRSNVMSFHMSASR